MQTLTFVCRQDFGTWIMHCYSWIGRYRDTAVCVCVCVCDTLNVASRLVIAFRCDYDSPGTVLCVEAKLKGRFTQIWQLKKKKKHVDICMCVLENPASLLWNFRYRHDFRGLKERISPNSFQGEETFVLTRWQQKKKKEEISTSGWAPSSYLFDMRLCDMSVLFMWSNILQWRRRTKYWCFNAAIWTFLVCLTI